jgi:hypothetical protein
MALILVVESQIEHRVLECPYRGNFLGDPLLRLVQKPVQQTKDMTRPLGRSVIAKDGVPLRERITGLGDTISLISRTVRTKPGECNDPLLLLRNRLSKETSKRQKLEKKVAQEIALVVEEALSSQ